VLQTDASSCAVGAILEQGGCVIAYASRTLNHAEQQYSVIYIERVFGHCICPETIQAVSTWETI